MTFQKKSGSKIQEAFLASQQMRRLEVGLLRSQPSLNSHQLRTQKQFGKSGIKLQKQEDQKEDDSDYYAHQYSSTPPSGKFIHGGSGSRQLKGNQELNDQLKMKANELEKLFAEHQLRVTRDQPNPALQSNISDVESDQTTRSSYRKQVAAPVPETTSDSPGPAVADGRNHNNLLQPSFAEVEFSDDSRGKSYDSYMKKRDARLMALWDSNGVEKEAKMKAMHDILERHSTEMRARLSWSADRQNSASSARRRAERLRSFNTPSALKREELDSGSLQDDEDLSGFGVSRNIQGKMPIPAIPRSATKLACTSGRRRQPDSIPLAQSAPNYSDPRKENTKPYSTATKAAAAAAARSQLRNYTRSRSTNEEKPPDKSRRSQSLRKSSVTSPESSEGVVLTQSKNMEPKRFLRKNTAKLKASMASEAMNKEEPPRVVKDDFEEGFDETETEDQVVDVVDGIVSRMSNESEKLMDSESEQGNTSQSQSFSQVEHSLVSELRGESPLSWNSRADYLFSYTHEVSDVESPIRSPASWNAAAAVDVARMRKKWGITQKPNLVPSSSDRKDMTRGFKRLLKFGRKSRYTENLADYISATTSDGDDDTEDGRDLANPSSEDLRKSRMGYSHGLTECDFYGDEAQATPPPANFREDHLSGSSIKAPRSFFSLSSFRSKGSESKPR